jgi:N-methylhydantoinase A
MVVATGSTTTGASTGRRPVCFDAAAGHVDTPVLWRPDLQPGQVVHGPAIVEEYGSTVPLHPGFTVRVDAHRNLVVSTGSTTEEA